MARFLRISAGTAVVALALTAALLIAAGASPRAGQPSARGSAPVTIAQLGAPLAFEPNAGRFPAGLDYLASARGVNVAVGPAQSRVSIGHGGAALTTRLVGAAAHPRARPQNKLPTKVNWYSGSDRSRWRSGLSTFAGVRYRHVYPGVDLHYHGHAGRLEYDFVVAPGAQPGRIAMALSGARSLRLSPEGDLLGSVGGATIRQLQPVAYQHVGGARRPVSAGFVLDDGRLSFKLGSYDHSRPLVIDPVLAYSDYLGGTGSDSAADVATDPAGNAYVGGASSSPSIPGEPNGRPGSEMGFVTKIGPGGTRSWITYLGSNVNGVAVDGSGNVLIAGTTTGALSVKNADDGTYGGGTSDGFAAALAPDGTTNWASYIGGAANDHADAVAADRAGDAYVAVTTNQPGLATTGAYQTLVNGNGASGGTTDAVVLKFSPSGGKAFATYIGGSSNETGAAIGVAPSCQSSCDIFVGGSTQSTNFPKSDAGSLSGSYDAYIFKLNPTGTSRSWAYYNGGSGVEDVHALAVNNAGNPAIAGSTSSYGNGTQAMFQTYNAVNGSRIEPDMLLGFGGSGTESAQDIAFDAQGNAYITGNTNSSSGFDTTSAIQRDFGGTTDAFVAKMKADGTVPLVWSTYLGGFDSDYGYGIATDATGGVFVVGATYSNDFPLASSTQANSTPGDAFIAKVQVRPVTIASGPTGQLRSHTASFTYSSGEPGGSFTCRLVPVETNFSACPNAGKSFAGLADGNYTFEIATVDVGSTSGAVTQQAFTVDTKPIASLVIAPNPVLVGRTVTFDGSGSSAGDQPIVKYEWDIDGDGSFERDTGTTATTTGLFDAPLVRVVSLRVTDGAGASSTATAELHVNAITGPSQFGVTINNGAQFTRSPDVTVTANFPAGTSSLLFSNDGGFLEPTTFKAQKATKWKLDSSGPERLPKTIYVRFLNGPIVSETHQDDIILDEVPPKVTTAQVAPAAATSSSVATASRLRSWKVKVKAKDSNSGVSKLQVTSNKKKPGKALRYKTRLKVKSKKRPRWIRARDRAGNWSHWKKAR